MPRRWHQPSTTGSSEATTGVLGTTPETGAITKAISAIRRREERIRSEAIRALSRSRAPLLNRAAETGNRPKRVISAGLPNPARASWGLSTPVAISRLRLSNPVSSGSNHSGDEQHHSQSEHGQRDQCLRVLESVDQLGHGGESPVVNCGDSAPRSKNCSRSHCCSPSSPSPRTAERNRASDSR